MKGHKMCDEKRIFECFKLFDQKRRFVERREALTDAKCFF